MTQDLVSTFYTAFAGRDGETMATCYHPDGSFEDPAFGKLSAADAGDMWRMLCSGATDLRLTHTITDATETSAVTNWIANYTFSATKRPVRNDVTAMMTFRDGKILDHHDDFNFWKWSRQALGPPGLLLGWTPFLKAKVQKTTAASLADFQAKQA